MHLALHLLSPVGALTDAVAIIAILGLVLAHHSIPEPEPGSTEEPNPYYD